VAGIELLEQIASADAVIVPVGGAGASLSIYMYIDALVVNDVLIYWRRPLVSF
jgi:threonine dehydratase